MGDVSVLILYTDEKKILLQHRSAYKERWANYWGMFGGSIEVGESKEEALQREILEELTYRVQEPVFLFTQKLGRDKKHVFVEQYDTTQVLMPCMKECQDSRFVTVGEARLLSLIPHEHEVLDRVEAFIDNIGQNT